MANPSTLYRFRIELSDIDRGVYEPLDFRVAMHPSETQPYLLTRVIAYALNYDPQAMPPLEFHAGGLSDADEPTLKQVAPNGGMKLWIEIGNPSARKLHKASKASERVRVYTNKDATALCREMIEQKVHRAGEIEIYAISNVFLNQLAKTLQRDNRWGLMLLEGRLSITIGDTTEAVELVPHRAVQL